MILWINHNNIEYIYVQGICDGAAAVIVASEAALKEYNLKPLARLVGYSYVGCKPEIMGIGPVTAIQNVLNVSGLKMQDIDLFEVSFIANKKKIILFNIISQFLFYF